MAENANGNTEVISAGEIISEPKIADKIYTIRGVQVMLDADLAEIYGYTTKALNQQVQRNIEKFEGEEFMFQLTREEINNSVKSQIVTSRNPNILRSQIVTANFSTMSRSLPYVFTEQGIYMLMTVLKGELATKQSRILVMAFKAMKDYILSSRSLVSETIQNSKDILELKTDMKTVKSELGGMLKKSEISPLILDFSKVKESQDLLVMNGELVKAKAAIIKIYNKAKHKITIIDNYVNYNTLRLLLEIKPNLEVIIRTNNTNNYLKPSDLADFKKDRPDINLKLIKTNNKVHDRFIILDNDRVFTLGASSKDLGNKLTTLHEILDSSIKSTILKLT